VREDPEVREQGELEGDLVDLVPLTAVYLVEGQGSGPTDVWWT
jgi:hypothetical protein